MTPHKIAKTSESSHQKALFAYCAVAMRRGFEVADHWCETGELPKPIPDHMAIPQLAWLHHIPNGGLRDKRTAANLKAEGVKAGVPDCFLPWPVRDSEGYIMYCGLYIEMKKPSQKPKTKGKGGLSDEQIKFKNYVLGVAYGFAACYSWLEAVDVLKDYIGFNQLTD